MIVELCKWFIGVQIPDHQFIIIAARSKLLVIEGPFKATNLLLVSNEFAEMTSRGSEVSLQDITVSTSSAHKRFAPRNGTDPSKMAM